MTTADSCEEKLEIIRGLVAGWTTASRVLIDRSLRRSMASFVGLLLFSHEVMSDSATPWTEACQVSLFSTISQSLLTFVSIGPVNMPLCTVIWVFNPPYPWAPIPHHRGRKPSCRPGTLLLTGVWGTRDSGLRKSASWNSFHFLSLQKWEGQGRGLGSN